jgi:hypothetical protein
MHFELMRYKLVRDKVEKIKYSKAELDGGTLNPFLNTYMEFV